MTKRNAPPIDDSLPATKADWDDIVSHPAHTNAIVEVMDNRLPPLVGGQKETPDQRIVKKWFGEPVRRGQKFDDVAACKYLEYYSRSGRKADAAIYAGVTIATICKWEGENTEFRDLADQSHQLYLSMIEREMLRRGVVGTLKPIVAGKDPEIVTYEREFSDNLLAMLAKKADPAGYGGRDGVNVNVHAGVLVAPGGVTEENTPLPIEDVGDEDDHHR